MQLFQLILLALAGFSQGLQGDPSASIVISQDAAVNYLKQWRPKEDGVTEDYFRENAQFALKTQSLPYAKQVSKEMFLKYVLPYSHFDEPRDNWRSEMYKVLLPFVQNKKTLQAAAEALFPAWGNAFGKQLHFKPNMTPQIMAPLTQTLAQGHASCTGMSIFLADCMRAVGIPARVVGVNTWNRPEGGNHNWVEIWMGDHWNFVDAVPSGDIVAWNQTWFNEQAKLQSSSPSQFAVMSPLWGPDGRSSYNMSWREPAVFVPAIDVTPDYSTGIQRLQSSSWGVAPATLVLCVLLLATIFIAWYAHRIGKAKDGYQQMP